MRYHGGIVQDGKQVADTVQCCHCGSHWVVEPGSGKRRGFCLRCQRMTCGANECDPCIPMELQILQYHDPIAYLRDLERHKKR